MADKICTKCEEPKDEATCFDRERDGYKTQCKSFIPDMVLRAAIHMGDEYESLSDAEYNQRIETIRSEL